MKLLGFTDLHVGEGHERCYHDTTLPLQRYRCGLFFDLMLDIFNDLQCDGLLEGGDLLDDRTSIPLPTIDLTFNALNSYIEFKESNYKLIGNHEMFFRTNGIHCGAPFKNIFNVIDVPTVQNINGVRTLFCPYPAEGFDLEAWLKENLLTNGEPQFVFGHFQVEGTRDSTGRTINGGVNLSVLRPASLVLLGHIHHPQQVAENVHYIGSPFQQDFGEADEQKRIFTLDFPSLKLEWINLDSFPTYRRLSFNEWLAVVTPDSENRYEVMITSCDEYESYIKHPLMARANPVYSGMSSKPQQGAQEHSGKRSFTLEDTLERYLEVRPPANMHGLTKEEFLAVGLAIIKS